MKVCHVCSGHSIDDSRVFHKECLSLAREKFDVHLIATGEQEKKTCGVSGVTIHPLRREEKRWSRFRRRQKVACLAKSLGADLYHVHEPELLGPILSMVDSTPVVFDVHESYLDVLGQRPGIPDSVRPLAIGYWNWQEKKLVRECAGIVTATEHIAERYRQFHHRVVVARNFARLDSLKQTSGKECRDGKTCVFAGTLTPDRNILSTVKAMGILKRKGISVSLWLAGNWYPERFRDDVLSVARAEGVDSQVKDFGRVTHADALSLQARASIGLVNILPIKNSVYSLPIKMLECMGLGLPVIYSAFPAFKGIAGNAEVGIAVDPENLDETADAIAFMVQNPERARAMGESGSRLVQEHLNWEAEAPKLVQLYRSILCSK